MDSHRIRSLLALAFAALFFAPAAHGGGVVTEGIEVTTGGFLRAQSGTGSESNADLVDAAEGALLPCCRTVTATSAGGGASTARATVEIVESETSVTITASGDVDVRHPGVASAEIAAGASGESAFDVNVCVGEPATFTGQVRAAVLGNGIRQTTANIGYDVGGSGEGLNTGLGDPPPLNLPFSDRPLLAGDCVHVGAGILSSISNGDPSTAGGSWNFSLTVTLDTANDGAVFAWKGGALGSFGDASNWADVETGAEGVPEVVSAEDADSVLFQNLGPVRVDLGGGAALAGAGLPAPLGGVAACAGAVTRRSRDLRIDDAGPIEPVAGTWAVGEFSTAEYSLVVEDQGLLALSDAALCAQSARVDGGSFVSVRGPGGFLQTLARLSVARSGSGTFRVVDGGVAHSEEVRIGEGGQFAEVNVDDATWQTGNIAVGFSSSGDLLIENAGLVESEQVFVDFNLPASSRIDASVTGQGSTWRMQRLEIGARGRVFVYDRGRLEATPETPDTLAGVIGSHPAQGEGGVLEVEAGAEATFNGDLVVGDQGNGRLVVFETGSSRVDVSGTLLVGPPVGGGPGVQGNVTVEGDPVLSAPSLFSRRLEVGGSDAGELGSALSLKHGAVVLTGETAVIGKVGRGTAFVREGSDWTVRDSLEVGPRGALFIDDATVRVGDFPDPGNVLIQDGGTVHGLSTEQPNRLICTPGGTLTNSGTLFLPLHVDCQYEETATGRVIGEFFGPPAEPAATAAASGPSALARRPEPATPSGPLVIDGDAKLAGTLEVQFMNGYAPSQGDRFDLLRVSGQTTGAFDNVIVRGLAPGAAFEQSFAGGELALTALNDAVALPTVGFKAKTQVAEGKKGLKLTVSRSGDTTQALTVRYAIDGSAQNGVDYQTLSGEVEIPARKKSAKLLLRPIADGIAEGAETIELEVLPGDDYTPSLAGELEIELQDAPVK